MTRDIVIRTEAENEKYLTDIEALMDKGEPNLTDQENADLLAMSQAVQAFEQEFYRIPAPATLTAMIELRMYEMKLNRSKLAAYLGVALSKLSDILNGKRPMDVKFLKALHQKLGIDADFLLQHA